MNNYYVIAKAIGKTLPEWLEIIFHERAYKTLKAAQKRADEQNKKFQTILHHYIVNEKGEIIDDCKNYGGDINDD